MYSKVAVGDAAPVSLGAVDAAQRATRVVVVGLGYVGLPLAVALAGNLTRSGWILTAPHR
jgi:UDP-N-acetyl-D-galactosamine dehydrogenase